MKKHKAECDRGEGRAGHNIRDYMALIREHHVLLHPTVMVALMSMMVLEGWQWRLDPAFSILDQLESTMGGGIFGYANNAQRIFNNATAAVRLCIEGADSAAGRV